VLLFPDTNVELAHVRSWSHIRQATHYMQSIRRPLSTSRWSCRRTFVAGRKQCDLNSIRTDVWSLSRLALRIAIILKQIPPTSKQATCARCSMDSQRDGAGGVASARTSTAPVSAVSRRLDNGSRSDSANENRRAQ